MDNAGDEVRIFLQFRVVIPHGLNDLAHDLVQNGLIHAHERGKAQGTAQKTAQHVPPALVGRQRAISNKEGRGTAVIGDNAQGGIDIVSIRVAEGVGHIGQTGRILDNVLEEVGVKVGLLALADGSYALKAHACINIGLGKRDARAVRLLVVLRKNQVPDFQEAVAVAFADAAVRAAGQAFALVYVNFGTGTTGAGVAHGPEIVLFTHAHNAAVWQSGNFLPDGGGFVVIPENGHPQLVLGQFQFLGAEFPGPGNGFLLEVVAEGEVPQHFKEGVVPCGAAHVLKVIVLAGDAQALLRRGCARVAALLLAGEALLELYHAGIGEKQGRVIRGNERSGRNNFMPVFFEKL